MTDKLLTIENIQKNKKICDNRGGVCSNCELDKEGCIFAVEFDDLIDKIEEQQKTIEELGKSLVLSKKQRDSLECYMLAEGYDFDFIKSVKERNGEING